MYDENGNLDFVLTKDDIAKIRAKNAAKSGASFEDSVTALGQQPGDIDQPKPVAEVSRQEFADLFGGLGDVKATTLSKQAIATPEELRQLVDESLTPTERLLGNYYNASQAFASGAMEVVASVPEAAGQIGEMTGLGGETLRGAASAMRESVAYDPRMTVSGIPRVAPGLGTEVSGAAGQALAMIGGGGAGRAFGLGAKGMGRLVGTMGGTIQAQAMYREAEAAGADDRTKMLAFASGTLIGQIERIGDLEALGLAGTLAKVDQRSKGTFSDSLLRFVSAGGKEAVGEGGEEGAQTFSEKVVAQQFLKYAEPEEFEEFVTGVGRASLVGTIVGQGLGGTRQVVADSAQRSEFRKEHEAKLIKRAPQDPAQAQEGADLLASAAEAKPEAPKEAKTPEQAAEVLKEANNVPDATVRMLGEEVEGVEISEDEHALRGLLTLVRESAGSESTIPEIALVDAGQKLGSQGVAVGGSIAIDAARAGDAMRGVLLHEVQHLSAAPGTPAFSEIVAKAREEFPGLALAKAKKYELNFTKEKGHAPFRALAEGPQRDAALADEGFAQGAEDFAPLVETLLKDPTLAEAMSVNEARTIRDWIVAVLNKLPGLNLKTAAGKARKALIDDLVTRELQEGASPEEILAFADALSKAIQSPSPVEFRKAAEQVQIADVIAPEFDSQEDLDLALAESVDVEGIAAEVAAETPKETSKKKQQGGESSGKAPVKAPATALTPAQEKRAKKKRERARKKADAARAEGDEAAAVETERKTSKPPRPAQTRSKRGMTAMEAALEAGDVDEFRFSVAPPEDSAAFAAWFQDSKVVDAEGRPLVVYHGGYGVDKLTAFDPDFGGQTTGNNEHGAFHFTDNLEVAEDYGRQSFIRRFQDYPEGLIEEGLATQKEVDGHEESGDVYDWVGDLAEENIHTQATFVSVQNPIEIDNGGEPVDVEFIERLSRFAKTGVDEEGDLFDEYYDQMSGGFDPSDVDANRSDIEDRAREDHDLEPGEEIEEYQFDQAARDVLEEYGFEEVSTPIDGVVIRNMVDDIGEMSKQVADQYIAFSPTQIKSATGNRGTFSATAPDIRFSVEGGDKEAKPFDPNENIQLATPWGSQVEEWMADSLIHVRNLQKTLKVPKGANWDQEDVRSAGLLRVRVDKFQAEFVQPIVDALKEGDITIDEAHLYLAALHSIERNATNIARDEALAAQWEVYKEAKKAHAEWSRKAKARAKWDSEKADGKKLRRPRPEHPGKEPRVPKKPKDTPKGWSTEAKPSAWLAKSDAGAIIRAAHKGPKGKSFRKLRELNRGLHEAKLNLIEEAGLEPPKVLRMVRDLGWKDYVPMVSVMEGRKGIGRPKGYSVGGKDIRRMGGRRSEPDNVLIAGVTDFISVIERAEKNRVMNTFARLVQANPDAEFWEVVEGTLSDVVMTGQEAMELGETANIFRSLWDARIPLDAASVGYKKGGKQYYIVFHPKGRIVADALTGANLLTMGKILQPFARVNRYYAAANTSWSLNFVVDNFRRDYLLGGVRLALDEGTGVAAKVLADTPGSIKAILQGGGDQKAQLQAYLESGAKTGYFYGGTHAEQRKDLERLLRKASSATGAIDKAGRAFSAVAGVVDHVNDAVENGIRFSYWKHLVANGKTHAEAAVLAKELTINFNKRGRLAPLFGPLYLFFNASMRGSVVIRDMAKKHGVKMVGGLFTLGVFLDLLNSMLAGDDDDGENVWDTRKEFEKDRYILVPDFNGGFVKVWSMPYGLNSIVTAGRQFSAMLRGVSTPAEAIGSTLSSAIDSFNPLGGGGGDLEKTAVHMAVPTALDPLADIAMNDNFAGYDIYNDFGQSVKPDSESGRKNTGDAWKLIAETANTATGGDRLEGGWADFHPETIRHLWKQVGGGVWRDATHAFDAVGSLIDGDFMEALDMAPITSKFHTSEFEGKWKNAYYDNIHAIKAASTREDAEGLREMTKLEKALADLESDRKDVTKEMRDYTKDIDAADTKEEADTLALELKEIVRAFNRKVSKARESQ